MLHCGLACGFDAVTSLPAGLSLFYLTASSCPETSAWRRTESPSPWPLWFSPAGLTHLVTGTVRDNTAARYFSKIYNLSQLPLRPQLPVVLQHSQSVGERHFKEDVVDVVECCAKLRRRGGGCTHKHSGMWEGPLLSIEGNCTAIPGP